MLKVKRVYLANFGSNGEINGQVQKSRSVFKLLSRTNELGKIDVSRGTKKIFEVHRYWKSDYTIDVSLGDKGIQVFLLLAAIFRLVFRVKPTINYFVVGGWLGAKVTSSFLLKTLLPLIDHIYVETETLKAELDSLGLNSEILVNFRFDSPRSHKAYQDDTCIKLVFCSRVRRDKGVFVAIDLLKELNKRGVSATLDIYGPVDDNISSEFEKSCLDRAVEYRGVYENEQQAIDILSRFDFLVFPSSYPGECMPGILVESFCAGTPILATDWKSNSEIVEDGTNGFVAKLDCYVEYMFEKINALNAVSYQSLSKHSIENYKHRYHVDAISLQYA